MLFIILTFVYFVSFVFKDLFFSGVINFHKSIFENLRQCRVASRLVSCSFASLLEISGIIRRTGA